MTDRCVFGNFHDRQVCVFEKTQLVGLGANTYIGHTTRGGCDARVCVCVCVSA
jgi:hypothetical protein